MLTTAAAAAGAAATRLAVERVIPLSCITGAPNVDVRDAVGACVVHWHHEAAVLLPLLLRQRAAKC
jgi:hypothetical protein